MSFGEAVLISLAIAIAVGALIYGHPFVVGDLGWLDPNVEILCWNSDENDEVSAADSKVSDIVALPKHDIVVLLQLTENPTLRRELLAHLLLTLPKTSLENSFAIVDSPTGQNPRPREGDVAASLRRQEAVS